MKMIPPEPDMLEPPDAHADDEAFREYGRQVAMDHMLRVVHQDCTPSRRPVHSGQMRFVRYLGAAAASLMVIGLISNMLRIVMPPDSPSVAWDVIPYKEARYQVIGPDRIRLDSGEIFLRLKSSSAPSASVQQAMLIETPNAIARALGRQFHVETHPLATSKPPPQGKKEMNKHLTRLLVVSGIATLTTASGTALAEDRQLLSANNEATPVHVDPQDDAKLSQWIQESLQATVQEPAPLEEGEKLHTWLEDRGVRGLYNRYGSKLRLKFLESVLENELFLSGPHQDGELNTNDSRSFGHYNPEAIREINETGRKLLDKQAFKAFMQPFYDRELKRLARTWYKAYRYCQEHPENFTSAKTEYLAALEEGGGWLDPDFARQYANVMEKNEAYDWYETHTAIRFWIRRSIDESDTAFFDGLVAFLQALDPQFDAVKAGAE